MNYITATHTDVGIKKATNQDSIIIQQAFADKDTIILAAVCDGMGGLAKGEVASATMVYALKKWFHEMLPQLLQQNDFESRLKESWDRLIYDTNRKIGDYGVDHGIGLGTTCCAFLGIGNQYYIMNVGDSRAYLISDKVYQLTVDQTVVQREIDAGNMTEEEAAVSKDRSVLLQCIGASSVVEPDFFIGELEKNECFMLCSDGFRHLIHPTELYERLNPEISINRDMMERNLQYLTELNKERQETDNISALLVKTC